MIHISNIKMRTKITFIVFLASIVVFIIAEAFTIKGELFRHKLKITELSTSSAQLISDYCGLILLNKTPENLTIGVNDFSRLPFVYDAIVFDTNNKILAEYHKSKDSTVHQLPRFKINSSCYYNTFFHIVEPIK